MDGLASEPQLKLLVSIVRFAAFVSGPLSKSDLTQAVKAAQHILRLGGKAIPEVWSNKPNLHGCIYYTVELYMYQMYLSCICILYLSRPI